MATKEKTEKKPKKTECPISRKQFKDDAKPMPVTIGDRSFTCDPREFSTNSMGWNLSEKIEVTIDGEKCKVQVGLNMTIIGSKEAK